MKLLMFFFSFSTLHAFAQLTNVSNLKNIINKGLCKYGEPNFEKKQTVYLKACERLGDYYTNLFKSNSVENNVKGVNYYSLAADLNWGTDEPMADDKNCIEIRDSCSRKLGDIYLHGIGIRKNKSKALYYHSRSGLSKKMAKYYSLIYFGNNEPFFSLKENNISDSTLILACNPFEFFKKDIPSKYELLISNLCKLIKSDSSLSCSVDYQSTLDASMLGQAVLQQMCYKIMKIITKQFTTPIKISCCSPNNDWVPCNYKSFELSCITIRIY